jgi:hypothetical protein
MRDPVWIEHDGGGANKTALGRDFPQVPASSRPPSGFEELQE